MRIVIANLGLGRSINRVQRWTAAGAIFTATFLVLFASAVSAAAGTQSSFNTGTSLTNSGNYTTAPTNSVDVLLTTSMGSTLTDNATSTLAMESLNVNATSYYTGYTISNNTNGTTKSTLTLGNSAGFTNAYSNVANDLIYAYDTNLTIQGANGGSTGSGTLVLALASSGNFDVVTGGPDVSTPTLTISAVISGSYGITGTGGGNIILSGNNTFTGALAYTGTGTMTLSGTNAATSFSASSGTVQLEANGALGSATTLNISGANVFNALVGLTNSVNASAAVTMSAGALQFSGSPQTLGSLAGTGGNLFIGDYTIPSGSTGAGTYTGNLTVGNASNTTFAGTIIGTTATGAILTKVGTGTLTLSGANTYTGVTAVTGGTLAVTTLANGGLTSGIGASSNAAANLLLGNGTTFQYLGAATSSDRLFTINGTANATSASLDASGTGALNLTNTGSIAYGTTAQTRTLVLTGTNTGANTLAATIADNGGGATTVTKSSSGTWVLSGANTYTGKTNINGGILNLGSSTALGTGTVSFGGGTLQYSASNNANLSSRFSGGANQLFNIDTNGQNVAYTYAIVSSGGTLTKLGAGTLSLGSNSSSYSGGTTVSAGTLLANGSGGTSPNSATGTGMVTVNSGGTIGGTGLIGGATMVNGTITGGLDGSAVGATTPGTIGILSLSSTLSINGTYVADISGATSDKLAIAGAVTVTNGLVDFVVNQALTATTYVLATYQSITGTFTSNNVPTGYQLDQNGTTLSLDAVPEPSTWLGGFLLLGTVAYSQRRRLAGWKALAKAA